MQWLLVLLLTLCLYNSAITTIVNIQIKRYCIVTEINAFDEQHPMSDTLFLSFDLLKHEVAHKTVSCINVRREDQVFYPSDRCFKHEAWTKWQTKSFTSRKQAIPQFYSNNCIDKVTHKDSDIASNPFLCYFYTGNAYFTD